LTGTREPLEKDEEGHAGFALPSAAAPPPPRARRSWLKRILKYSSATVALIAGILLVSFVVGFFEGFLEGSSSSSSPGDPSSAGVIDSGAFWSQDSRLIAFDRSDYGSPDDTMAGASDVFVASADGTELRRLTRTPHNETVLGWLSNPRRIVYASYEKPKRPTSLYALDPRGGAPVRLGEVRAADQLLALSHDGRRALVGTPRLDPKRYALVDLVRNTRRPLPGIADYWADGAWSRDDSMLAYVTGESIVILRGDRVLRRVPLGQYDSASGGLAWSPDGRRLAYGDGGDNSTLWLVRIKDGSRSRLTEGGETSNDYPVWSPDGSKIYYEHGSFGDHDGLRMMSPDGTGDRKITNDDWAGGGLFNFEGKNDRWLDQVRISPDGTKIAYLLGERGAWKNWSLVGVMNADGSGKTPFPGSV
jgi:Tol biopolymer transport system component